MEHDILPIGKLPPEMLERLLDYCTPCDPRVIVGASVGEDAAILDLPDRFLVAKSDPITFATDRIGWYAVHVNANDIASRGATPRWMLMTLLLPEGSATYEMARAIVDQTAAACCELGVALVGGHTEVTHGLDRPIVVGHMLGEVAKARLVTTGGAEPGDVVVLAGRIAVEGTALIAREWGAKAQLLGVDEATLATARGLLDDPGISVVRAANLAVGAAPVHAMHDPTEGGLATGLHELAWAAQVGMEVDGNAIPVLPECACLCQAFGLDPLGLIASGALLIVVAPEGVQALGSALAAAGIPWARIATVTDAKGCMLLRCDGRDRPLPRFDRDEITRVVG